MQNEFVIETGMNRHIHSYRNTTRSVMPVAIVLLISHAATTPVSERANSVNVHYIIPVSDVTVYYS